MQYIDHTQPQRRASRDQTTHHTRSAELLNTTDMPPTITTQKGFRVRLDFVEGDFIESE